MTRHSIVLVSSCALATFKPSWVLASLRGRGMKPRGSYRFRRTIALSSLSRIWAASAPVSSPFNVLLNARAILADISL